jgi:hypothetical protein
VVHDAHAFGGCRELIQSVSGQPEPVEGALVGERLVSHRERSDDPAIVDVDDLELVCTRRCLLVRVGHDPVVTGADHLGEGDLGEELRARELDRTSRAAGDDGTDPDPVCVADAKELDAPAERTTR